MNKEKTNDTFQFLDNELNMLTVMCDAYVKEMLSHTIVFILLHPLIHLSKILKFI